MKGTLCAGLMLALTALASPAAHAQSTTVGVDKVRYCRSIWPFCNDTTDYEYRFWPEAGVPDSTQKQTWMARYNDPGIERTEHVVFLAAGSRLGDEADPSLIAGNYGWEHHAGRDHYFVHSIQDASLPYQLFARGVFSRSNTFMGLGFDSRYRGGMEEATLDRIVNAHYNWLRSKVDPARLKSVYLAGHSRSGVLALRLARRFKADFPDIPVVVDAFDPVARTSSFGAPNSGPDRDDMGVYTESIDNPTVNYPRNTGGLNDQGNWSWKSNLREQFPVKKNFFFSNYINGGKMPQQGFNFAQETRSFTLDTGSSQFSNLGWLYQEWRWVPNDIDGHIRIAQDAPLMSEALDRVADRLDMATRNIAPRATVSASSTYPGYDARKVNDLDLDSRLGEPFSWTNLNYPEGLSEWLQLSWPTTVRTNRIEVVSSEGYLQSRFKLQYHDGANWVDVPGTTVSSDGAVTALGFDAIETTAIRLTGLAGPAHQPGYFRVNEILVREAPGVSSPNLAPQATATASSTFWGYAPAKANDGDFSTALGGEYSWTNEGYQASPQWLELSWAQPLRTRFLEVHSSDGYALQGFDVQYQAADGSWRPVSSRVSSTLGTYTSVSFDEIQTSRIRLVNFVGPQSQLYYYRVNELAVYGDYANGAATISAPDQDLEPERVRFRKPIPMREYTIY